MGEEGDATPFTTTTVEEVGKELHSCGYQLRGNEVLYSGHTSKQVRRVVVLVSSVVRRLTLCDCSCKRKFSLVPRTINA